MRHTPGLETSPPARDTLDVAGGAGPLAAPESVGMSADVGRQVSIGGDELVPPRLDVAALTPREVSGEIFDMDLPPCPVGGEMSDGQTPLLDDQDGLVAAAARTLPRALCLPIRW